jgi:uncharacterized protein YbjT (DUF2867 family)
MERGHAVRGTTRREDALAAIESVGAQAVRADPDRLATLLPHLDGVSALCWLLASAHGDEEALRALHGPRLETILDTLVDTHVRGFVYEATGIVPAAVLDEGAGIVERVARTFRMPVVVVRHPPADVAGWVAATAGAVDGVLA